ncbi:MAG: hypothetical protein G3W58_08555 [Pantoea ananatis]|nr:hypothetical protein [Pantoea ananatis]
MATRRHSLKAFSLFLGRDMCWVQVGRMEESEGTSLSVSDEKRGEGMSLVPKPGIAKESIRAIADTLAKRNGQACHY